MFILVLSDYDCAIQDRDGLKYQITELQRENQRLGDKLQSISPNFSASKREVESLSEQTDKLKATISELQKENQQLRVSTWYEEELNSVVTDVWVYNLYNYILCVSDISWMCCHSISAIEHASFDVLLNGNFR